MQRIWIKPLLIEISKQVGLIDNSNSGVLRVLTQYVNALVSNANHFEYIKTMIIACPSCATQQKLPQDPFDDASSVINCSACGHSWLEARAVEVIETPQESFAETPRETSNLPAQIALPDTDDEAARIARAIQKADEKRRKQQSARRKTIINWSSLAACAALPLFVAVLFPQTVVKALPGSIVLYEKAGMNVNIRGFEINNVTRQYVLVGKTRVLAIKGEITNISKQPKAVPSLHFALLEPSGKKAYSWTLNNLKRKPLGAGGSTSFLTRLASPPKTAEEIQIRFAQNGEMRSNAEHARAQN